MNEKDNRSYPFPEIHISPGRPYAGPGRKPAHRFPPAGLLGQGHCLITIQKLVPHGEQFRQDQNVKIKVIHGLQKAINVGPNPANSGIF